MEGLGAPFRGGLDALVAAPAQAIKDVSMVGDTEAQLLAQWAVTPPVADPRACVHELFDEAARRTPEAMAVADERGAVSFAALRAQPDQLAADLQTLGVGPEIPVAL